MSKQELTGTGETYPPVSSRTISRQTVVRGIGATGLRLGAAPLGRTPTPAMQGATPTAAIPYRFRFGSFTITAVPDGDFVFPNPPSPAELLFANAPRDEAAAALRANGQPDWASGSAAATVPVTPILVETGSNLVLLDTGGLNLGPTMGRLLPNLRSLGIAPDDIDTVVLSHAHTDHVLGTLDAAGRPAFPNARYVMGTAEHAFISNEERVRAFAANPGPIATVLFATLLPPGTDPAELLLGSYRGGVRPIEDRLALVDEEAEEEIVPGLRAVAAYGHTQGHIAVAVASGEARLLVTFDAWHHPLQVSHPDWGFAGDADRDEAVASRRRLLARADAENAITIGYHLPFPGVGRVRADGDAWRWEPATPIR